MMKDSSREIGFSERTISRNCLSASVRFAQASGGFTRRSLTSIVMSRLNCHMKSRYRSARITNDKIMTIEERIQCNKSVRICEICGLSSED